MKQYLSAITIFSLSILNAGEFHALGGQSISMGGAGVASASGSLAGYYNPALLTQTKGVEVSLGLGLAVRENNIGEQIDKLSDMDLNDIVDRIAKNAPKEGSNRVSDTKNIIEAQKILGEIEDKNGVSLMPTAHLGVQYDNMAIGIYMTSEIVVSANVDKTRTDLVVTDDNGHYFTYDATKDAYGISTRDTYEASSLQYSLENKTTSIDAKGLVLTEVPVSYAHAFDLPIGELSVGGSLKLMHGTTYTQTIDIDSKDATDEDSLKENQEESDNIGLDVGVLFKPTALPKLKIGLVAKNLNAPSFDLAKGGSIKADLQVRTGLQYNIANSLDVAVDLDLTSNTTLINGFDSQMFGGGVNFHPLSWFALRAGAMQNLANSNEGLIYTAGIAFGLQQFQLDVSAEMSSNTGAYDGEDIPKYAKVNVALVSKW
jgi:hypothetical protein